VYKRLERALGAGSIKPDFRVCHFSVQDGHIHLICEADDAPALSRGVQGVNIRIARAINNALGRRGKVFADRFHVRPLRTPTETRNALNYVLNNRVGHMARLGFESEPELWIDPCSSGRWFDGWRVLPEQAPACGPDPPLPAPETWLLAAGWRRLGLLVPGDARERRPSSRRRPRGKK